MLGIEHRDSCLLRTCSTKPYPQPLSYFSFLGVPMSGQCWPTTISLTVGWLAKLQQFLGGVKDIYRYPPWNYSVSSIFFGVQQKWKSLTAHCLAFPTVSSLELHLQEKWSFSREKKIMTWLWGVQIACGEGLAALHTGSWVPLFQAHLSLPCASNFSALLSFSRGKAAYVSLPGFYYLPLFC
jgi:hypothetical protein